MSPTIEQQLATAFQAKKQAGQALDVARGEHQAAAWRIKRIQLSHLEQTAPKWMSQLKWTILGRGDQIQLVAEMGNDTNAKVFKPLLAQTQADPRIEWETYTTLFEDQGCTVQYDTHGLIWLRGINESLITFVETYRLMVDKTVDFRYRTYGLTDWGRRKQNRITRTFQEQLWSPTP